MGLWGNEDTLGLWPLWTGFGYSCTPDRVGGPDSWVHDLLAGRSCVGHMMDVSMGGLAVQSQACCSNSFWFSSWNAQVAYVSLPG